MAVNDPKQTPTVEALLAQWEQAQVQFRALRAAVEQASRLAALREQVERLSRQRELAFKSLGEALWAEAKAGRMELPRTVGSRVKEIENLETQQRAQAAEISALLAEGTEFAQRLQKKPAPPTPGARTPVTKPVKKR